MYSRIYIYIYIYIEESFCKRQKKLCRNMSKCKEMKNVVFIYFTSLKYKCIIMTYK